MIPKKIVGFGDSFVYGNELSNNDDGNRSWPALVAAALGCDYETMAVAGCGNENIAQQIYSYFSENPVNDTLAVVNWTWSMRWDFYLREQEKWIALGPTCVPNKIEGLVGKIKAEQLIAFYHEHTGQSDIWNKFRSLQSIYAAQCWMKSLGIVNIQTFMDRSLFEINQGSRLDHYRAFKDPNWPEIDSEQELYTLPTHIQSELEQDYRKISVPNFIKTLQECVRSELKTFNGLTFLEWSYQNHYAVTELLHPLEEAHLAASELWKDRYAQMLGVDNG